MLLYAKPCVLHAKPCACTHARTHLQATLLLHGLEVIHDGKAVHGAALEGGHHQLQTTTTTTTTRAKAQNECGVTKFVTYVEVTVCSWIYLNNCRRGKTKTDGNVDNNGFRILTIALGLGGPAR